MPCNWPRPEPPARPFDFLMMKTVMGADFSKMWISGDWIAGALTPRPVINPTTGGVIAEVPEASATQARLWPPARHSRPGDDWHRWHAVASCTGSPR